MRTIKAPVVLESGIFAKKRTFRWRNFPSEQKNTGQGGYDPGLSGLSVFYGLSILPAPFRCLAGLPAASQASGGSHKRAGNPHKRPADLTSGPAASQASGGSHKRSPATSDDQAISVTL